MPITDEAVLSEIQRVTLEGPGDGGASWPSGMWTRDEVLGYANQRKQRLRAETGLLWTVTETAVVAGQAAQAAPADWVATVFRAWVAGGLYRELPTLSALEIGLVEPTWATGTSPSPLGYQEGEGLTLTLYVLPPPDATVTLLEHYYVALGLALTGNGVLLDIPDEFAPTLKYGVLADMLGKIGPAHSPALAQACEERWTEGIELGKLMAQEGWFAL